MDVERKADLEREEAERERRGHDVAYDAFRSLDEDDKMKYAQNVVKVVSSIIIANGSANGHSCSSIVFIEWLVI